MKNSLLIKVVAVIAFFALLISGVITSGGCANRIPPSGGPRDSLPPILLEATPPDSTRNFGNKRITFVFNEFVEVNNIMENLIVSPAPKISPVVESKLRTVTVKLIDTLEENTTYTLDFGNAIRDINEGNEVKDFTYMFTTGTHFDSLQLSGRVILAESGGVDSTLIVVLHTSADDSAVAKERPRYYTRLDRNGNFAFINLPATTFRLYAMKDEGGMRQYRSPSQLFAFADQPVRADTARRPFTLYAYREKPDDRPGAGGTGAGGAGRAARPTQQDRVLRITTNIESEQLDLLKDLEIRFATPLKNFDSTKVRFTDEQFNTLPIPPLALDTSRRLLTVKYQWVGNTAYNVIVNKDFAEDSLGRKLLRDDTLSFRTRREADYGSVKLRFLNLDLSKNPVLQFVQNGQLVYSHVFTGRDVNIRLFVPGEYELRLLLDENRNGKWDPGQFFGKRRQPERVQPISRKLNVKANWDNEIDITL